MGIKQRLRDEFPRRWWCSRTWWWESTREGVHDLSVVLATWCYGARVRGVYEHRRRPVRLRQLVPAGEVWVGAVLINAAVLGLLVLQASAGSNIAPGLVLGLVLWCTANLAASLLVTGVLLRSRLRYRATWRELDFIRSHAPRHRPPETVEEYQAVRAGWRQDR